MTLYNAVFVDKDNRRLNILREKTRNKALG